MPSSLTLPLHLAYQNQADLHTLEYYVSAAISFRDRGLQRVAPAMQEFKPRDRYPIDLNDDAALDTLIRNRADTVYHPVGTCRMGADDEAVVDPTLKARAGSTGCGLRTLRSCRSWYRATPMRPAS